MPCIDARLKYPLRASAPQTGPDSAALGAAPTPKVEETPIQMTKTRREDP